MQKMRFPSLLSARMGSAIMDGEGRVLGEPVQTGLQTFTELRVERDTERQPDVVLGLAAEAGHEVVELAEADRNYVRGSPVITAAKSRGERVVRDGNARAENVGGNAIVREAEEAVDKERAFVVRHLDLGAKHVGVDGILGSVLVFVAAVQVS